MPLSIHTFFDIGTSTFTHVAIDLSTRKCAIIDPVLGYDPDSGKTDTQSADRIVAYVQEQALSVQWILETHVHADHLTAAWYLKDRLGGKTGIGANVKEVLAHWVPLFHTGRDTPLEGTQFDHLFHDGEVFQLGHLDVKVFDTPGHTPACISYSIKDALFVGDTIFMPDIGTARTDFPGGSASALYDSIQKIFRFPDSTRLFLCHDYPPSRREVLWMTTIQDQKRHNILVREGMSKEDYIAMRRARDKGKPVPRLLLPSLQVNLRAGFLGCPEDNHIQYIKIPINILS